MMNQPMRSIALTGVLLILSTSAFAVSFNNLSNCTITDVTLVGGQNADDCSGYLEKSGPGNPNPTETNVNDLGLFGHSDWMEIVEPTVTSNPGLNPTTWTTATDFSGYNEIIFAFKQADGFSAYLFEDTSLNFSTGTWSGLPDGVNPGISHIQVLGRVSEVPLPAAAWLFISALGGLGYAKHRKSR